MSVDLFVFRPNGELTLTDLVNALESLLPDAEYRDGSLLYWGQPTLSVDALDGWVEPEMAPLEKKVYSQGHLRLSGTPAAWGTMLHVAAHLCEELDASAFDPQEATFADLQDSPSLDDLRASHDARQASSRARTAVSESPGSVEVASAVDRWEAQGWLELSPDADRDAVDRGLEVLVEAHRDDVEAFVARLLDLEGVEEVYATDREVEGFLDVW